MWKIDQHLLLIWSPRGGRPISRRMALKVSIHFMHEHLPFGCQSHDSSVEIRNKLEINYLRSSHAVRSGVKPGAGERTSWCWWIQPCKLVFLVGPLSFYNRSGCVCKILRAPWGIWHEGWSWQRMAHMSCFLSICVQPAHLFPPTTPDDSLAC